jgi:hypothetical protein
MDKVKKIDTPAGLLSEELWSKNKGVRCTSALTGE